MWTSEDRQQMTLRLAITHITSHLGPFTMLPNLPSAPLLLKAAPAAYDFCDSVCAHLLSWFIAPVALLSGLAALLALHSGYIYVHMDGLSIDRCRIAGAVAPLLLMIIPAPPSNQGGNISTEPPADTILV